MMKRRNEDSPGSGKRSRSDPDPEQTELRVLIQSKNAGAIIGKGGENIKRLRSEYNASVNVPDSNTPERIVYVSSDLHSVCECIRDILPKLEDNRDIARRAAIANLPSLVTGNIPGAISGTGAGAGTGSGTGSGSPPGSEMVTTTETETETLTETVIEPGTEGIPDVGDEVEIRMLVHQSQAGAVIGRAGFKIKELREQTDTAIKVYTECCPLSTDRVVQVNGKLEKVVNACREILQICFDTPLKGASKPYDTINYDPSFVYDYGGFQPDRTWRGGAGARPSSGGGTTGTSVTGTGGNAGGTGSFMGAAGRGGPASSRLPGPPPGRFGAGGPPPPMDAYSTSMMSGAMARPPGPMGYGPPPPGGPIQTTQVTIPKDLAGTIIGKGGERINRIREDSGAHIIVDPAAPGTDERIITISGNPNQIQMAQYLLQQCVRSSAAGRKYIQQQSH